MSDTLQDLYEKIGENTHKWEHYIPIYERYMAPKKGEAVRLLEIGVQRGGSLKIWQTYFNEKSEIIGVDIDPECKRHENDNITVHIGDQSNPDFLKQLRHKGPFDFIIDDGGHTALQQILTFQLLYDRVTLGGFYIVEDTHTSFWPQYMDHPTGMTFMDFAQIQARQLNAWHFDQRNFIRYHQERDNRKGSLRVPKITRSTKSICFYDSMIVFERANIREPFIQRR